MIHTPFQPLCVFVPPFQIKWGVDTTRIARERKEALQQRKVHANVMCMCAHTPLLTHTPWLLQEEEERLKLEEQERRANMRVTRGVMNDAAKGEEGGSGGISLMEGLADDYDTDEEKEKESVITKDKLREWKKAASEDVKARREEQEARGGGSSSETQPPVQPVMPQGLSPSNQKLAAVYANLPGKIKPGVAPKKVNKNKELCTSDVRGVSWEKVRGVWRAHIRIKREKVCLGHFATEQEAVAVRAKAWNEAFPGKPDVDAPTSSEFTGVCWNKREGKWQANIRIKGRKMSLGRFDDAEEAARVYDTACIRLGRDPKNFPLSQV